MKRVAVTGMGVLNSLGQGIEPVWRRVLAGENGIAATSFFNVTHYRCKVAGEVRTLDGFGVADRDSFAAPSPLSSSNPGDWRRGAAIFHACAQEAFAQSGLQESGFDRARAGVSAGGSVAFMDLDVTADYYRQRRADGKDVDIPRFAREGSHPPYNFRRRLGDAIASLPAKALGFRGPVAATDTACAASGHAIGEAFRAIRDGSATVMIAGGASALVCATSILYFQILGALSQNPDPESASRPFDKHRDGFVMGEGGGAVVLEDFDHAKARGARILAELAGYGYNTCAINLTDPSPDGSIECAAMRQALEDGGVSAEEIGYIAAHGTSTAKNDATECKAIRSLLGARAGRVPVSSNKGHIGHTISGAAVTNFILAILAMRDGVVPPTIHLHTPDPDLDLDFVANDAKKAPVEAALVNSFAFGGHNAVMALKAA